VAKRSQSHVKAMQVREQRKSESESVAKRSQSHEVGDSLGQKKEEGEIVDYCLIWKEIKCV